MAKKMAAPVKKQEPRHLRVAMGLRDLTQGFPVGSIGYLPVFPGDGKAFQEFYGTSRGFFDMQTSGGK